MGFESGRAGFRRFRLRGFAHNAVDDVLLEKLNAAAFGRYDSTGANGMDIGWVTPQHLFDVDFGPEKISFGRFAYWVLRCDRNTPPAAIVRSYVAMERQVALEASGREFLSKKDIREAKENAKLRAEKEARSGAFRRITSFPVMVDLEKGMLYLGSTSTGAADHLQKIFTDTFEGARAEPVNAHALALELADDQGLKRALEDAVPVHLIDPPDEVDGDVYSLDPEDRGFLGREFLSWVWHRVERSEGVFELLRHNDVAASLVTQMQLRCDFNLTGSTTVQCEMPSRALEGRAALTTGKQPVRLGMLLAARAGEWSFTLDAANLDVSGVVLPATDSKERVLVLESRFESMADLSDVVDALYAEFLRKRLSNTWPQEWNACRAWAQNRERESRPAQLVSA